MNQVSRVPPMVELLPSNIVAGTPSSIMAIGWFTTASRSPVRIRDERKPKSFRLRSGYPSQWYRGLGNHNSLV
jgi:hypothetical protein